MRESTINAQVHAIGLTLAITLTALSPPVSAKITKFTLDTPQTRNFGFWRLTHDPAVRDYGNYHNTPNFSHDGRYTCYTHYPQNHKGWATIHVVDLHTGEDINLGKGIHPRWGHTRNWIFFARYTGDLPFPAPGETKPRKRVEGVASTAVMRHDLETGEQVVITRDVEIVGGTDPTDTWLFGSQRFRATRSENIVRMRNEPGSEYEVLDVPTDNGLQVVNPMHPVVKTRWRSKKRNDDPFERIYGSKSLIYTLDGGKVWKGAIMAEEGHHAWSGDGKYLLSGNKQMSGRIWNQPWPSDLHMLANNDQQDISPMGKLGRYVCGTEIKVADLRSGDTWYAAHVSSHIIYPATGDNSTLMDIDPKGSPDGTKIHFHATHEQEKITRARITHWDSSEPAVITVDSTDGFPDTGDIVCHSEVMGYARKSATTFEQLTRRKYGTVPVAKRRGWVLPLSTYMLDVQDKPRGYRDMKILKLLGGDESNPLVVQKQSDCYLVIARLPYPPHLRIVDGQVQLIPGEAHWETRGYRIVRNGVPIRKELFEPGARITLPDSGSYTAVAVEWSNLQSPPSLPLQVRTPTRGHVLKEVPRNFSWTRKTWFVGGRPASHEEAMKKPLTRMKLLHLHDGVIALETWQRGVIALHEDLNNNKRPTRILDYEGGRLARRSYRVFETKDDTEGWIISREEFGADGFKTQYVRYHHPNRGHEISEHIWYDRGRPIRRGPGKGPDFDFTGK